MINEGFNGRQEVCRSCAIVHLKYGKGQTCTVFLSCYSLFGYLFTCALSHFHISYQLSRWTRDKSVCPHQLAMAHVALSLHCFKMFFVKRKDLSYWLLSAGTVRRSQCFRFRQRRALSTAVCLHHRSKKRRHSRASLL